jgi:hypothetical protein
MVVGETPILFANSLIVIVAAQVAQSFAQGTRPLFPDSFLIVKGMRKIQCGVR